MGKARSLRDRVSSYFINPQTLLSKTALLVGEIAKVDHIVVESEVDAFLLEASFIKKLQPKYNLIGKDGKNFPLVEINRQNLMPLVKIVHQETSHKNTYIGPFPTGSDIRGLLRYLRRIFPYATVIHKDSKICFYGHLGLCPCANREIYKANLKKLVDFLTGKRKSVQKSLEKEMLANAKAQKFEAAAKIKRQLEQIAYITSGQYKPWQYEQNPNLVADRLLEESEELKKVLSLPKLEKIECFDIANISGKSATGAQVVFIDGLPEKKFYRRYRIKLKSGPNDVGMMKEMLARRLKSDIPLPDLFVIDGGKEHLFPLPIKTIGLAKRLETIYTDDGTEIQLGLNSPALHLLQRLRDEAHRFSRKYHFYLRSKKMLE